MDKLKQCFSFIDLTTLNATDTQARGRLFAENVNRFARSILKYPMWRPFAYIRR